MGDIGKVNQFQYASTAGSDQVLTMASASVVKYKNVYFKDLKVTCGATARTLTFKIASNSAENQKLSLDIPASSMQNFTWDLPYIMRFVGSTSETKSLVASASGAGIKYVLTGYTDTPN